MPLTSQELQSKLWQAATYCGADRLGRLQELHLLHPLPEEAVRPVRRGG